jgi:hypothetical protein
VFFRFQFRHGEQMEKNIELVTTGEPYQVHERLPDEGRSLVRTTLLGQFIDS